MTTQLEQVMELGPRFHRPPSLHDQLIANLRAMIMNAELAPGTRIPEARLCALFDISRTPLREALKVLAWEGLVDLRHNRGGVVAGICADETRSLFEFKYGLEDFAGRLIADRITADEVATIEALHVTMLENHRRRERRAYFATNISIHQALINAARNPVLSTTYESLTLKVSRVRAVANNDPSRWDSSVKEHEGIMTALADRNGPLLSERMRKHSRLTAEAVLRDCLSDRHT